MNYKLGKLAAHHDVRTLMLADYLDRASLPAVPRAHRWSDRIGPDAWGMMLNDHIGDCACADPGHQIMAWTSYTRPTPTIPADADILAAYSAVSGFDPRTGANDVGCVMLDVMKYWRNVGIAGHKIDAFAGVPPHAPQQIMTAIFLFGGVSIGVGLPLSARDQLDAGQAWTPVRGPRGAEGSWGGHAIVCLDYDPAGITCVTWGRLQKMSWDFVRAYCDEVYAAIALRDWAPNGVAPSGLNRDALMADLKRL
jgi:hypothetical protein